jgi:DNA polymerase-3 subunit delta'
LSTTAQLIDQRLASAVRTGQACHAFFISGPDDRLCYDMARKAAMLVCAGENGGSAAPETCPDYFELNGGAVKIDRVREIIQELNHRPTGLFGRAIVVRNAHALTSQVQNALLKTIEEPPAQTVFFLTGNADGVLPTVASRCCVMRVGLLGKNEVYTRLVTLGATSDEARLFAAQSGGSVTRGERLFSDEAYRNHRTASLDAFVSLLSGGLPVSAAKSLASDAGEALAFMLSFASDMLRAKLDGDSADNSDRAGEARRLAGSFTIGKLTCMIDMLSAANANIVRAGGGWYYAVAAMNRLFLDISEVVNK